MSDLSLLDFLCGDTPPPPPVIDGLPVAKDREDAVHHVIGSLRRKQPLTPSQLALLEDLKTRSTTTCSCCGGAVGLYSRSLNASMAASLVWLVKHGGGGWMDIPKNAPRYVLANREYPKLVYWGMIESQPNTDPSKKGSGQWKVTQRGIDFANQRIRAPKHLWVYQNLVYARSRDDVSVVDALGTKFDYAELMK